MSLRLSSEFEAISLKVSSEGVTNTGLKIEA